VNFLQAYLRSFRGLSREVWTLSLVGLVNRMGMMVMPYLALYLTRELSYSVSQAGLVLGIYGTGSFAGIALGGYWTDRIGYRPVQLASLFSSGALLILLGQLGPGASLCLTVFAFGLATDVYRPANNAALAQHSSEQKRARAYGLYRLAINLGWSVGPALGGFLARVDYGMLFWVDGCTTLLAGLYLAFALPAPKEQPDEAHAHGSVPESQALGASRDGSPWRDRVFLIALGLLLLQSLAFFQLTSTLPLYLAEQRGLGEDRIGLLMLFNTLVIVFFELPLISRVNRFPQLKLIALSSLFVGVGFGLTPWALGMPLLIFSILIWTVGEMLGMPIMTTWVSSRSNSKNRGRYMAAFGMCFSVGQILGPIMGTRSYDQWGPNWPWHLSLGLGILSWAGLRLLARRVE